MSPGRGEANGQAYAFPVQVGCRPVSIFLRLFKVCEITFWNLSVSVGNIATYNLYVYVLSVHLQCFIYLFFIFIYLFIYLFFFSLSAILVHSDVRTVKSE